MRRSTSIRSLVAAIVVGASFAVVGCGGAIPVGLEPVFASGVMLFTPDTEFNGDATNFTDPQTEVTAGSTSTATLTLEDRVAGITVHTDRPILGQLFNLHSSSAAVRYTDGTNVWNLGSGFVRFGGSEGGPALYYSGTLNPDTDSGATGEADVSAVFAGTGIEIGLTSSDNRASIFSQVGDGDITEVLSGTGFGSISTTGPNLSLTYTVGDQRIVARWNPGGTPGQSLSGTAEVEYNPDVNGSTGNIEASSGTIHVYYDSNTQRYTVSLVNVMITVDSTTYRMDGFLTGVWPS